MFSKKLEDCSKEELIYMIKMLKEVKKAMAYLEKKKLNKNIK